MMRFESFTRLIAGLGLSLLFLLTASARPAFAQFDANASKKVKAPKLKLSPDKLDFGDQIDTLISASQTVTVTNESALDAIAITSIVVPSPFVETGDTCGSSISAGGFCTVSVAFQPSAPGKVKQKRG